MPLVTLNNKRSYVCESSRSLLDAAKDAGLVLEHSCRTGRCSACKAMVLEGQTEVVQPEESLTPVELAAGYVLTCCRTAITDVVLDVEDLGRLGDVETKTLPCRVDSLDRPASNVVCVTLRTPPNSPLRFIPGQYIDVIGVTGVRRSYSLANSVRQDNRLELHIRQVSGGAMSAYWFGEAKSNDLLRLEGPLGTFCFRPTTRTNVVFLATGTGVAPIKAILEDLACNPGLSEGKKLHLYWGGRTEADVYWQPEFPELDLTHVPVLSQADAAWDGRRGYVQNALLADGLDLDDTIVYACGSAEMIRSARELLMSRGLNKKYFYSDAFVSSS